MKTLIHELINFTAKKMSKTQISKIAIILLVLVYTIACKKENASQIHDGLTPSASNTTFEQTMSVQVNGNTLMADSNISGKMTFDILDGYFRTSIDGIKINRTLSNDEFILRLRRVNTKGLYSIKNNEGECFIRYNDTYYGFDFTSSSKSRLQIELLNVVDHPTDTNQKYVAANFNGVVYHYSDSININGTIRFK